MKKKWYDDLSPVDEIREELRARSIYDVVLVNFYLKHKYPRLFLLCFSIVFAYVLFSNNVVSSWVLSLENLSYLGILIAGFLFSFGFTAPFAVGFFLVFQPENILLATFIAGVGSVVSDLLIYEGIHSSFSKEFDKLGHSKLFTGIKGILDSNFHKKVRIYLMYSFAGFLIATPLPDEIGVSMIAGLTSMKRWVLAVLSFVLHTLFIYLIIVFGVNF